jgi:two-component system chemotaxis response regulator CheB
MWTNSWKESIIEAAEKVRLSVMSPEIKVLIIEDSALMRRSLRRIIESAPDLRVAGAARDASEGLRMVKELQPDVVTIDVNLPDMDGLECLQRIMIESPRPCLMVSAYTGKNSAETFEALELGAADFVEKPSGEISRDLDKKSEEIRRKIRIVAAGNLASLTLRRAQPVALRPSVKKSPETSPKAIVVIGVSTGGPRTLMDIIPALPPDLGAPVLIVQHMPEKFTPGFAERMDKHCVLSVKEAQRGEGLRDNVVYVAPGGKHLTLTGDADKGVTAIFSRPSADELVAPSVNKALDSAVDLFGNRTVGVVLTGMGDDGARAMARLHSLGGITIAESEESAVIFGMPKEVITRGAARIVAHSRDMATIITRAVRDALRLS